MRTTRLSLKNLGFSVGLLVGVFAAGCGPDYPNCDNDEDCHEGEYCVNGMCQQCRGDEDCGPGRTCADGACQGIPGYCESNADCAPGEECQENRCRAAETASFSQTSDSGECTLSEVFFAFDEDNLDQAARSAVQQNVACMQQRSLQSIHLTGHADPRGTEEYNLALGDRRARAVSQYLQSLGAGSVTQSSMGEEMASGSDEMSWRRDRKVEFVQR